jgi:ABC-type glutathione transport system ATPase component
VTAADLLVVHDLSVDYELADGAIHAARDVSFTIAPGERVGFVGESGSGKTTVALALLGMLRRPGRIVGGSARLEGVELIGLERREHARLRLSRIAYVPQGAMNSLNPVQAVRRSIADGLVDHGEMLTRSALADRVAGLLRQVGLPPEVADRYPHELSGGMKQRVCIAIAISLSPRLILADEPTSALDVVTQRQVMETLGEIQSRLGSAVMMIGHDIGLMAQTVDRLVVMKDGRVVETGEVRHVLRQPAHPYTRDLIASVPTFGEHRAVPAAGAPPADGAAPAPVIQLAGVGKIYDGSLGRPGTVALRPLDLVLEGQPRILAVVGESGSGKTTLGDLILGFVAPTQGAVLYRGQSVTRLRGEHLRAFRRDVQAVFQDPYSAFNPFYRVDRALAQPLLKLGVVRGGAAARKRIEQGCVQVGLDPDRVLGRFTHQLSGGQRQRLMVARALMLRPRILVADEPVSMVDASLRFAILDALRTLRDRYEVTVIYVTHDLATAHRVSDRVLVLRKGEVVEDGDPDAVLRHPVHPYTRLLVDAIPWPDPDRAWGGSARPHSERLLAPNA